MHTIETRRHRGAGGVVRICGALALILAATAAQAVTYVVNRPNDASVGSTPCSGGVAFCNLRDAIDQANHNAGADTITFAPSVVGINLGPALGAIPITDALTITGPGAAQLTIDAQNNHRVFDIDVPTPGDPVFNVTISGLTLIDGEAPATQGGGAIYLGDANLTLTDCEISASHAQGGGGALLAAPSATTTTLDVQRCRFANNQTDADGGALGGKINTLSLADLTVEGNTAATDGGGVHALVQTATVQRCLFRDNHADTTASIRGGGGLTLEGNKSGGPTATISDTRFESNAANNNGGGGLSLYRFATVTADRLEISGNSGNLGGGLLADSVTTLTLRNSTIAGNTATTLGGGIATTTAGAANLTNVTIAGNTASSGAGGGVNVGSGSTFNANSTIIANNNGAPGPDASSASGSITLNYSLIKSTSGVSVSGANNLAAGTDPQLDALDNYGGNTLTLRPKIGSPVLNVGDTTITSGTDQRGLARFVGGRVDLGAAERQNPEDIIFRNGFE